MSRLSVGIIGLDRVGTSIGLAVRRYMKKGGAHQFDIIGHDTFSDAEKHALKSGAVDKVERRMMDTAVNRDIVILNLSYDEVKSSYKSLAQDLRAGAVLLDLSPLKQPSVAWAREYLHDEQHLIGMSVLLNPRYLFVLDDKAENAEEDLFDNTAIILSPAANCAREAVDLAFNFCTILGSKPRFLDPEEHDALLGLTDGLPILLGTALFYTLMNNRAWQDMQWFTNPAFAALSRPLRDVHPDALRDEWLLNRESLTRGIDDVIGTLQTIRAALAAHDRDVVEAMVGAASEEYEKWINHRYQADWDKDATPMAVDPSNTLMGTLLGGKLAGRLMGKKDNNTKS